LDLIFRLRQMMAESKFSEVQRLIEVQLSLKDEARPELLLLYSDVMKAQQKQLPIDVVIELAELLCERKEFTAALELIDSLNTDAQKFFYNRITKIKIEAAEVSGQMNKIYEVVSAFLIRQFEKQIPFIPTWIEERILKYFKADFNLKLKYLALTMLVNDMQKAERLTNELIASCIENASPKGIKDKLSHICEVLKTSPPKSSLEIYRNFCLLSTRGISEKSDYKRLVEMTIFYTDFKFQALILNLLLELGLKESAKIYASAIEQTTDYDFVYLDKFLPHLKSYFVQTAPKVEPGPEKIPTPDLKMAGKLIQEVIGPEKDFEDSDEESRFLYLLKYQEYTSDQLCDLAVSFLQSELPRVSLKASQMAMNQSENEKAYLKGAYLKLTSLLQLKDYRAALDTCLEALTRASSREDILSFLYGQAEVLIRLNKPKDAKIILSQILSIDSDYRLAKERLNRLNEI
jgi:tetratricopeptide (TPR) repeat protein